MTQRKPPGVRFETWIDRQIREAQDRGEFDNLAGAGQPLADLDEPHDDLRWVRQKLRRENVSFLPPSLALRKEVEDARAAALAARSDEEARRLLTAVNAKVRDASRLPLAGPAVTVVPIDLPRLLERRRAERAAGQPGTEAASPPPDPEASPDQPSGRTEGTDGAGGAARTGRRWRLGRRRSSRSSRSSRS